jgi:hypothetical protein
LPYFFFFSIFIYLFFIYLLAYCHCTEVHCDIYKSVCSVS